MSPSCHLRVLHPHAEREPVGIEARRKADGWHAEHVDPGGIAMPPITQRAVLRHRLIRGRHLDRGVDEPIQVQAVQFRLVKRHHRAPRPQEVCFRLRIALQRLLRNAALLTAANNHLGQRFADGVLVLRSRVIPGRTEMSQERFRALADIGPRADVGRRIGKTIRQNLRIDQLRSLRQPATPPPLLGMPAASPASADSLASSSRLGELQRTSHPDTLPETRNRRRPGRRQVPRSACP